MGKNEMKENAAPRSRRKRNSKNKIQKTDRAVVKNEHLNQKADRELSRLSQELNLNIPDLLLQLQKNRPRMTGPKADLVDLLLTYSTAAMSDSSSLTATPNEATDTIQTPSNTATPPQKEKRKKARPKRPNRPTSMKAQEEAIQSQKRAAEAIKDPSLLTNVFFSERTDLHPSSKRAITDVLGLTKMTEIQSKTFAAASSGKDVLARARTGTGKTLAFLLPAIEVILQDVESISGLNVGILVVSPTRELATQIGDQASSLLTFHDNLSVQVVFGGTKIGGDINKMARRIPTILVATPGRLIDHLENTNINGRKFSDIISQTKVLVLDETDQLLDMGFRREIKKIMDYLPRQRQTLLFSATLPDELRSIMTATMRKDSITVDCINDGDVASHTNLRVDQSHVILPSMDRYVSAVVETVLKAIEDRDEGESKVVVFFPTARLVGFFSDLFNKGLQIPVIELHSKKSQSYRNGASDRFRAARSAVLFTSDVSARGVDYPDVTHVLQFGIPDSREQYIHRLGRTGRAGKEGKGWLILAPYESNFLRQLSNLDVPTNVDLVDMMSAPVSQEVTDILNPVLKKINNGDKDLSQSAAMAYQAFLGYYLGQIKRTNIKNKGEVVSIANELSSLMGLRKIPSLEKRLISKMGLNGVEGVHVKSKEESTGKNNDFKKERGPKGGRRGNGGRGQRR